MKKFLTTLLVISIGWISTKAQTADPYISINATPASVLLNTNSTLSVVTGNFGNDFIVSNSLRVTVSTGSNSTILGVAAGSDPRWAVSSLSAGNGNTIVLTNTGAASFGPFGIGSINLDLKGTVVNPLPSLIVGNISYIVGVNPLLGAQSAIQGNLITDNDNSTTSLTVTGTPNFTPSIVMDVSNFTANPPVTSANQRDFVAGVIEIAGSPSTSQVIFRLTKLTGYTITFNPTATSVAVGGSTAVQNNDWIIDDSSPFFITCTLKPAASVGANGSSLVGFNLTRNPATGAGAANLGATIQNGTGGDINNFDNGVNRILIGL